MVINNIINNEGIEFEVCWVVNEQLVLLVVYINIEVINLIVVVSSYQFGFLGVEDFVNIDDFLIFFGGILNGNIVYDNVEVIKVGIFENMYGLIVIYDFFNGYVVSVSVVNVDEVVLGYFGVVMLFFYILVNVGLFY